MISTVVRRSCGLRYPTYCTSDALCLDRSSNGVVNSPYEWQHSYEFLRGGVSQQNNAGSGAVSGVGDFTTVLILGCAYEVLNLVGGWIV